MNLTVPGWAFKGSVKPRFSFGKTEPSRGKPKYRTKPNLKKIFFDRAQKQAVS
jgi:hypothetical protein